MARRAEQVIYIDRNPDNPDEGWGWVLVWVEDMRRFDIDHKHPAYREVTKQQEVSLTKCGDDGVPYIHTYINTYTQHVNVPSRGKAGAKKFVLNIDGELVTIKVQKSLTIGAVCSWLRSWAPTGTNVITPGNRSISLDGDKLAHQSCFVYFIFNEDSNAIKIGWAKDLDKRMRALQTSSPATLKLLKSVQVEGVVVAQELERSLHRRFHANRLSGEWFKAEGELLEYVNHL